MRRRYDVLLKFMKSMVPFWNVMVFGYVWALFYNEQTVKEFWIQRMFFALVIYTVIYVAFAKLYNAFKIGTYKLSELFFSQLLAFGIADFCMYLESCVMHHGYVNILPGVVAVGLQFTGSCILIGISKRYFTKFIPAQKTLLIYGRN